MTRKVPRLQLYLSFEEYLKLNWLQYYVCAFTTTTQGPTPPAICLPYFFQKHNHKSIEEMKITISKTVQTVYLGECQGIWHNSNEYHMWRTCSLTEMCNNVKWKPLWVHHISKD